MSLRKMFAVFSFAFTFLHIFSISASAESEQSLLNVSYDVSRELYKDINPAFIAEWKAQTGVTLTINQSHGGSSRQALSIISGLEADVVTMNQSPDIDILVERGGYVAKDWRTKFPYEASPYSTTTVFLVRKGNPKALKDWGDLVSPGLQVIIPNPKTSGNGRYSYLAAWGYALKKLGSDAAALDFVRKLFANVPVLDGGGRGATTSFTQREIGDVLLTFENEAIAIGKELGEDKFDIVYPSISVDASAPVALVEPVADRRKSRNAATAYLNFLFSDNGQTIIAAHFYRPRNTTILAHYASQFPTVATFKVETVLGGWEKVQKDHFADGASYDQIMAERR